MGHGKQWEREIASKLRAAGIAAERIRGSGGGVGTDRADLLVSSALSPSEESHRTITDALERGVIDEGEVRTAEVKCHSSLGGLQTVYNVHMGWCLDSGQDASILEWRGGYYTGSWRIPVEVPPDFGDVVAHPSELPQGLQAVVDGVDIAFVRHKGGMPWVAIWREW